MQERHALVLRLPALHVAALDQRTKERLDHVGMYVGHDTDGHKIFISSREEANGPTIGDKGGTSRLDGNGYYAATLRSAKRL